jgi:hypothetical protein
MYSFEVTRGLCQPLSGKGRNFCFNSTIKSVLFLNKGELCKTHMIGILKKTASYPNEFLGIQRFFRREKMRKDIKRLYLQAQPQSPGLVQPRFRRFSGHGIQ